jgi:hypothetical protein
VGEAGAVWAAGGRFDTAIAMNRGFDPADQHRRGNLAYSGEGIPMGRHNDCVVRSRPPSLSAGRDLCSVRSVAVRLVVGACVILGVTTPAAAQTEYFVRKTGNDGNSGLSAAAAWQTIDKAANTVGPNSVVYVGAGTYNESITPVNDGLSLMPIRYVADTDGLKTGDAGAVLVTGVNDPLYLDGDDYQQFAGFTFSGNATGMTAFSSTGLLFEDCEFIGASGSSVYIYSATATFRGGSAHGGGYAGFHTGFTGATLTLEDFDIFGNAEVGIWSITATNLTMDRCRVYGNGDGSVGGINIGGNLALTNCLIVDNIGYGIYVMPVGVHTIYQCTFDDNTIDGLYVDGGTVTVQNCIITNSGDDGLDRQGGTLNHSYNLVWNNTTNYEGTTAGTGEVSADPLYAGASDWHVETGSPALDNGTDLSAFTTVDLDGIERPSGVDWDMGAYEFYVDPTNYRSIGMDTGVLYTTGTGSITAGSRTMDFSNGASLPANVGIGDKITIGGDTFYIYERISATQVTVHAAAATTRTNVAYTIMRAYNTVQAWETARQGDLVGQKRREVGVAYNDAPFTAFFTVDGSATDSSYYMHLTVAEGHRHDGTAGTGVHLSSGAVNFRIRDHYFRMDGFEFTVQGGYVTTGSTNFLFEDLLIHNITSPTAYGIDVISGSGTIRNCIIYDAEQFGVRAQAAANVVVENCTVYDIDGRGYYQSGGTMAVANCIAMDCTAGDFSGSITQSYNMASDGSASGTGSMDFKNAWQQFESTTSGSEDLHLAAGSEALDAGTPLSFDTDIDGGRRGIGAGWDIGADEIGFFTNYRSIGTNAGTLASGTASIAQNSTTMIFTFSLPDDSGVGDKVTVGGNPYYIKEKVTPSSVYVHSPSPLTIFGAATVTRAYTSLQDWEDDRDGDLSGEGRREVGVAYADGALSPVVIDGSTTSAEHYMHLTVAEGYEHNGTAGGGVLLDVAGAASEGIFIRDDWVRVDGLEVARAKPSNMRGSVALWVAYNVTVEDMLIHDYDFGGWRCGISLQTCSADVRNCIIYDGESWGIACLNNMVDADIDNCTVHGMKGNGYGIYNSGWGTLRVTNCIAVDGTGESFYGGGPMTDSYCISSDATAVGTGSRQNISGADLFVSTAAGSEDFHLKIGCEAIDNGTLLTGFTTDIDGETRSGPWDIGADEYSPVTANYRSIGTYAGTLYNTGTATVSAGLSTVTFGGGAALPESIGQGDELVIGAETMYIMSRDSATQVTIQLPAAAAHTGAAYAISRCYNTLQAWEDDRGGDLAGDRRCEIGVCYNDGPFSAGAVISGSTTNASSFMTITVAEGQRHSGVAGTGVRIDAGGSSTDVIAIEDEYVTVEWLEISNFNGASTEGIWVDDSPPGDNALLQHLIIHNFPAGNGINVRAGVSATVRNTIVYDGWQGLKTDGGTLTVENVTVHGMGTNGMDANGASTASVRNTIIVGSGSPDFNLEGAITYFGYNMYGTWASFDPASHQGNNQTPPADLYDLFYSIAPGSENLHLEDFGHDAVDTGLDLSASFSTDIDDEPRSGSWDLGADEINPAALTMSSGTDQAFAVGDGPTQISTITITDSWLAPRITAADDIRIRIPDAFDMTWDTFDTIAVLGGPAAGKVSAVVGYEDGGQTLVLDVTADFAADDSVSISELAFANFGSECGADNLELDVDGDPSAEGYDVKTVEIGPAGAAGTATLNLVWWREMEPAAAGGISPIQSVTFDQLTTNTSSDTRSAAVFSHTIGSTCATDGVLLVICATRGDQGVTSVTYDGQALTEEVSERAGTTSGDEWVSIWYLTDPPLGTNTVTVNYTGSGSPSMVAALSYFGVDQADPIGAVASASVTTDSSVVTVDIDTTAAESVVVGGLAHHGGDTVPHDEGGDVTAELYDIASGQASSSDSSFAGGEIATTTTGTYTFEWTNAVADDWAIACVELKPAP